MTTHDDRTASRAGWTAGQRAAAHALLKTRSDDAPPHGARERVWRQLQAKRRSAPPRGMWRRAWPLPLLVTAAVVALVFVRWPKPAKVAHAPRAPIEPASVVAQTLSPPPPPKSAFVSPTPRRLAYRKGEVRVDADKRFVTGKTGRAVLAIKDVGSLLLRGGADVMLNAEGREAQLDRGALVASIIPREGQTAFAVVAGAHRIDVKGTVFEVRRLANDAVEVDVHRGVVTVSGPDGTTTVRAGQGFSSRAARLQTRVRAVDLGLLRRTAGADQDPSIPVTPAPRAVLVPTGTAMAPTPGAPPAISPSPIVPSPIVPSPIVPPPDGRAEPSLPAALQVAARDPSAGIAALDRLRAERPDLAEMADLHAARAAGALSPQAAVARFERHLRQFPGGDFDVEARLGLVEARLRTGDTDAVVAEVDAFLRKHTRSERRGELLLLRAEALRRGAHVDATGCASALPDYEAAAAFSRAADDATFLIAHCRGVLDPEASVSAFRAYLQRFPRGRHAREAEQALPKAAP